MKKGYIEGYYGRLFSKEEREMVINHMGNLKMDFYIYGPKEDPYHRLNWQLNYPKKQCDDLRAFLKSASKNKITLIPWLIADNAPIPLGVFP